MINDKASTANQKLWDEEVRKGCGYTVPWLNLDLSILKNFIEGKLKFLPEPMTCIYPAEVFAAINGKNVLCLASGGGQQSAVFSLLGAKVTVVDLSQGQLEGDRKAASHYGYEVITIHGDMRDLSCFDDNYFDLVFQANSLAYVPDVHQVYSEVERVLKQQGRYRIAHINPATFFVNWDGKKYYIKEPYKKGILKRDDGGIEFRHYMDDIFNGLIDKGFLIERVYEEPHSGQQIPQKLEGLWDHQRTFVGGGFVILAKNNK